MKGKGGPRSPYARQDIFEASSRRSVTSSYLLAQAAPHRFFDKIAARRYLGSRYWYLCFLPLQLCSCHGFLLSSRQPNITVSTMFFSSNSSVSITTRSTSLPAKGGGFKMFLSFLYLFRFLISPAFWSKTGFFISYVLTFLLVLEVVRLASTDANRKQVEKMLDAYSASRSEAPVRRRSEMKKINIDELENMAKEEKAETMSVNIDALEASLTKKHRTRTPSPAVTRTPEYERAVDKEERRRRRAMSTSISPSTKVSPQPQLQPQPQMASPARRLRKRSDTLNSSSSAETKEAKGSVRRRREVREASPASSSSSRHESPTPRSRSKETKVLGASLGKMLRSKA